MSRLEKKNSGSRDHRPDLIIVTSKGLNGAPELVWDVELVGVEEEEDSVDAFGEPLQDPDELVAAVDSLLLSAQDARSIDDGDACDENQSWRNQMPRLWACYDNKA